MSTLTDRELEEFRGVASRFLMTREPVESLGQRAPADPSEYPNPTGVLQELLIELRLLHPEVAGIRFRSHTFSLTFERGEGHRLRGSAREFGTSHRRLNVWERKDRPVTPWHFATPQCVECFISVHERRTHPPLLEPGDL